MIPPPADTINRFLVGDDGRTVYYRVRRKNFHGKVFEYDKSNEHIVFLKEGGPAIKIRTVTQEMPNLKDDSQKDPRSKRNTKRLDFVASGGQLLPKQCVRHELGLNRNFRIKNRILEKYGPTMGCKRFEDKIIGDDARPHSSECRAKLEELMREADVEAEIMTRRDDRREQRAKVIAERNKAVDEEGSEPRTAPQPSSSSSNGQQERQVEANNARRKPDDTEEQEKHETRSKGWHA